MENVVIATELAVLSLEPVAVKLCLHTEKGSQEFVITDEIAHDLTHMLCSFLLGGQCNIEPSIRTSGQQRLSASGSNTNRRKPMRRRAPAEIW